MLSASGARAYPTQIERQRFHNQGSFRFEPLFLNFRTCKSESNSGTFQEHPKRSEASNFCTACKHKHKRSGRQEVPFRKCEASIYNIHSELNIRAQLKLDSRACTGAALFMVSDRPGRLERTHLRDFQTTSCLSGVEALSGQRARKRQLL